jgi:RHS repeat-associated core domain protein (fragment)
VYDGGSYTPVAKLTEEDSYSIVQDYLGTPIQALDSKGNVVWDCILDIYGDVLELRGERNFIPFRFQGQCEDQDQGLIDADSLNLNEIRRLQEEMLEHISNARKSGLNLNDYFKEGLHLRISSCK